MVEGRTNVNTTDKLAALRKMMKEHDGEDLEQLKKKIRTELESRNIDKDTIDEWIQNIE